MSPSRAAVLPAVLALLAGLAAAGPGFAAAPGPAHVEIVRTGEGYRLQVDGRPFHVNGAGLGNGSPAQLAAHGGNALRTWDVPDTAAATKRLLDEAQAHGLKVALGLRMEPPRSGFDYTDAKAVARQREELRRQVLRAKDHPAVLMWLVGNELNLESRDVAVWSAVEGITKMIHGIDPHHPVMTPLAGFSAPVIAAIKEHAPSLDGLGVQLYGDIAGFAPRLRAAGWDGPYLVTEWGATGHWESPLTAWGAPIEDHGTRKAELLVERHQRDIAGDPAHGLGSFAFLWGDKQERTPTWYGLWLPTGEATPGVDALQYLWTGAWPAQRSPVIREPLQLGGQGAHDSVTVAPAQRVTAAIGADDANGDALAYRWSVLEESGATSVGGDPETKPRRARLRFEATGEGEVRFAAPRRPGAYRLFVEVLDGTGRANYANLPFRVAE